MKLFITGLESLEIELSGPLKVASVKDIIFERAGVAREEQLLIVDGETLLDERLIDSDTTLFLYKGLEIRVKLFNGNVARFTMKEEVTVEELKEELLMREGLEEAKYELFLENQKLSSGKLVELDLEKPLELQKPANRCQKGECNDRIAKIIGICRYCEHAFCSKHRLPESHSCNQLGSCREQSFEKNSIKVMNGKCVADKV